MRASRKVCGCALRTRTTLSRAQAPRTTATSERGSPSTFARKRSTSALALPSCGGAATFSFRAAPYGPSIDVRLAPGETLRFRRIPSFVGVKKPLLTPAQEAAGPEDAAVPPVFSFRGGALIALEELLRAALFGE